MRKIAFDNAKYIRLQHDKILDKIHQFENKLYLEFGGKLFDDYHASRVLPGFQPDSKVQMLMEMRDTMEMVVVINANDIESNKVRGDNNIPYDQEVLRLIDAFRNIDIYVGSVVVTQYASESNVDSFILRLERLGLKVYKHHTIKGYPNNIPLILSDEGFGRNDYVETKRPLVVVTGPGSGSGKMAVCLSQLYLDYKRGLKSGYAKFETFPIYNLPLKSMVNLAYEAATADLNDVNIIDPYHLEAYGKTVVSYNRDVEAFPVLKNIFIQIIGESPYNSPTDMGVNMVGDCIVDMEAADEASKNEIIRRYFRTLTKERLEGIKHSSVAKIESIMAQANISIDDRPVVKAAHDKAVAANEPAVAIELENGRIVTGKTSTLFRASASALLNAIKVIANIDEDLELISRHVIHPVQELKVNILGNNNPRIHADEMLVMLSVAATTNPVAELALKQLPKLRECEAHSSVIIKQDDVDVFSKLGMNLTCSPEFRSKKLYHKR